MIDLEKGGKTIIDAAMMVHSVLGPGLLEKAYEECLAFELTDRGFSVRQQVPMPLVYRGVKLDIGYRMDLLVEARIVVEVKAVRKLDDLHEAQLLSYLKQSRCRLGYLFNFHELQLKNGIKRMINGFE